MYPAVSRKDATQYIVGRQNSSLGPHDLSVVYKGASDQDWGEDVEAVLASTLLAWEETDLTTYSSDQARDSLEGELSALLHEGLRQLPAAVLTDRDFWRFCAASLYDFIVWRHQSSKTVAALYPYFGAASEAPGFECVPLRMFDRAHVAREGGSLPGSDDPYALARFGARDVWASHILRVRTSYAPLVAHEILMDVRAGKLPTDIVRDLAKNLKRVRSNVLFEVLDSLQARDLVNREEERVSNMSGGVLDFKSSDD